MTIFYKGGIIDDYITSFDAIDAGTLEEMKKKCTSLIKFVSMMFSFKVKDRRTSVAMYVAVRFENVMQKASGDIYVKYEEPPWSNYVITYLDTSVKAIENELVTNNEFEKVN